MRKSLSALLITLCCLALDGNRVSTIAYAVNGAQRVVYKTYTNTRYGYSISYPSNLLTPQGEADNGDGQAFRSADGTAEMRVYGSQDMGGGLAAAYDEARAGKNFPYKVLKGNWFVVSGRNGDRIYYQKTMFKGGVLKTFTIEYDTAQKSTYDAVTARVARSFVG